MTDMSLPLLLTWVPLFMLQLQQLIPGFVHGLHFAHSSFQSPDLSNISFVKEGYWYTGQGPSLEDEAIWLNPNPSEAQTRSASNVGKIVYKDPIQLINYSSFSTSFTFQIITTSPYPLCGSGFAFFISATAMAPPYSNGRYLGLAAPNSTQAENHFFALEFDTHLSENFKDPSASHIGIDVNSLISLALIDSSPSSSKYYPNLFLYNNSTFTAWIEYSVSSKLIQVWMTNSSRTFDSTAASPQRSDAILNYTYDLSSVFGDRSMYVGFSATSNASVDGMEGVALYSWSFTVNELDGSSQGNKKKLLLRTLVPSLGSAILVLVVACWGVSANMRPKQTGFAHSKRGRYSSNSIPSAPALQQYTHRELKRAADGFSANNKIGEGAFGIVYKGALEDGTIVAIKKLKQGVRKESQFASEMKIISSIRHRHLLELLGWCYEGGEAMLVYKFMSNGSLDAYLYGKKRFHSGNLLNSEVRLQVLLGVASALEYLHGDLKDCVLHRDVKAANVLLTDDWMPMLADFGLARLISHNEEVTLTAAGTPGYIAPEVVFSGKATDRSDVYSFGMLALELAYGRRVIGIDSSVHPHLLDWIWQLQLQEGITNPLLKAMDPRIRIDMPACDEERWKTVLHVALMCCNPLPKERPTMRQIHQVLKGDTAHELLALNPKNGADADADASVAAGARQLYCTSPFLYVDLQSKPHNVFTPSCAQVFNEVVHDAPSTGAQVGEIQIDLE